MLAAAFVLEQKAGTEKEKQCPENENKGSQVERVGKTGKDDIFILAIFRNGA